MKRTPFTLLTLTLLAACGTQPKPPQPGPSAAAPRDKVEAATPQAATAAPEPKLNVALTPRAAARIKSLRQQTGAKYLRVTVAEDDYKLDLDESANPADDLIGESLGVAVVVDKQSAATIQPGTTIDFAGNGFKFSSPQPKLGELDTSRTLAEARQGFKTALAQRRTNGEAAPAPPTELFRLVRYDAPPGKLAAYVTPDPRDGKKHPAIIWIHGGDCNSIGDVWSDSQADNEQTASAHRKAGIVMMFPSLRGGNNNPGAKEHYLGEVDDVLASADFLAKEPYVDPARIYLGGHSTGGTLALLVAECSPRFRAVFSFGPIDDATGYSPRYFPAGVSDAKEVELRAPIRWLHSIRSPVFVFEGAGGNRESLLALAQASKNPLVRCFEIQNTDHFNVLDPVNKIVASKILKDVGEWCDLAFTQAELNAAISR